MKRHGEFVRLELADLIRMNRLIRGQIDYSSFVKWFDELAEDERRALVDMVFAFAGEAGVTREAYDEAMRLADLEEDEWAASSGARFWGGDGVSTWERREGVRRGIKEADEAELRRYLKWVVYVFGVAEGRVYARETPECCNHWWHRDLTDERVVEDLLNDPRYVYTSMKDDVKFKRPWWKRLF